METYFNRMDGYRYQRLWHLLSSGDFAVPMECGGALNSSPAQRFINHLWDTSQSCSGIAPSCFIDKFYNNVSVKVRHCFVHG